MYELRPVTLADAPVLIGWAVSEAFLTQWVGWTWEYPLTLEQLERHLRQADGEEPAILSRKLVDTGAGEMVGYIELCSIDRRNRSATVGRVIVGPERLRGKGLGGAMVREIVRIGFEELGLHRIGLVVFDFNRSAVACYERAGFRIEGRLRDARRAGDEYWSLYSMSLLEDEWRAGAAGGAQASCPHNPARLGSSHNSGR